MKELFCGIIYKCTCLPTGGIYIGQTKNTLKERIRGHFKKAKSNDKHTYFLNALNKYGKDSFVWEEIDKASSKEDLNTLEQYWISFYHTFIGDPLYVGGYNMNKGGASNSGYKVLEETKAKKRAKAIGKKRSLEARKNISDSLKGRVFSEDHRKNLGISSYLRNARKVICLETLEIFDSETQAVQKYGQAVNGNLHKRIKTAKKLHFEFFDNTKLYSKIPKSKIYCIELNLYFDTTREASLYTSIKSTNIKSCLMKRNKTAGKLHWEYGDVYINP